jgi:PAS domain S-box-containing protein
MKDKDKTKEQLINELTELRQRVTELEALEVERKRAEEALIQEKKISDDIISSLPGIFYMYDERRSLVRWNKMHEEALGYSAQELAHMHVLDFFEGEDKALIKSRVDKIFAEGQADAEARIVTKNGERIPYYFTGLLTTLGGKRYFVGLGVDITERVRAEEKLIQEEKDL